MCVYVCICVYVYPCLSVCTCMSVSVPWFLCLCTVSVCFHVYRPVCGYLSPFVSMCEVKCICILSQDIGVIFLCV